MAGLRTVVVLALLLGFFLGVGVKGHRHGGPHPEHDHDHHHHHSDPKDCTDHPLLNPFLPPCDATLMTETTVSPSSEGTTTTVASNARDEIALAKLNVGVSEQFASTLTELERAHWCRHPNGTHFAHGQIFMDDICRVCQCKDSRLMLCDSFECMPTYCVDNKMPVRKSGQCCTQCEEDEVTEGCMHNGLSFPHGAIMKEIPCKMTCWCQLGRVECRNYMGSMFQNFSPFADGKLIIVLLLIVFIPILIGLLLCCSCSLVIYYYVYHHHAEIQQTYDQYMNPTGWEPIVEEEQYVLDAIAEEKEREAEKSYGGTVPIHDIPPPYALYEESDVTENEPKKA